MNFEVEINEKIETRYCFNYKLELDSERDDIPNDHNKLTFVLDGEEVDIADLDGEDCVVFYKGKKVGTLKCTLNEAYEIENERDIDVN